MLQKLKSIHHPKEFAVKSEHMTKYVMEFVLQLFLANTTAPLFLATYSKWRCRNIFLIFSSFPTIHCVDI